MKKLVTFFFLITSLFLFTSCGKGSNDVDASGNFEAEEIIVGAEASGKIIRFDVEEGQALKAGQVIGYVDTTQLSLRKKQLQYSIRAVLAKQPNAASQLSTIQEQIETANFEKKRVENLLKADAATQKQLDDLNAQLAFLQKQYNATKTSLSITSGSLQSETYPLKAQIEQLEDQIKKSVIINPVEGTVLTKYMEKDEITAPGKALYKIADLTTITFRAYISGNQLSAMRLGETVKVLIDDVDGKSKSYDGKVSWVSDKAEFTPKTIQTKDERANLVYAVKIAVKSDGYLKLGMYGDLKFNQQLTKGN
jgi:HlyD family secretion protein